MPGAGEGERMARGHPFDDDAIVVRCNRVGGLATQFLRTFEGAHQKCAALVVVRIMLDRRAMGSDRIDFISSYCDRWCERCAYTSLCSAYACEVAAAMCGDFAQGLELAVGTPHPVDGEPPVRGGAALAAELWNVEMSPEEFAAFNRLETARSVRLADEPLSRMAMTYTMLSHQWLSEHSGALRTAADPVLAEALDVVMHDSAFVSAKLHRALDGRDRHGHDEDRDEDSVQNDWNGSAKVALISLERSEVAWRVIVQATNDGVAATLTDAVRDIRGLALDEFPRAMTFVRPGFDEP
jgi:hypothetical protein